MKYSGTISRGVRTPIIKIQVVMMVLVVHPTERALKKNFDKDGNRRIKDSE